MQFDCHLRTLGLLLSLALLPAASGARGLQTSVSSDTVGGGFLATSTDPNKVGVGGVWDFATPYYADDISGTDSTQFWTFIQGPNATDGTTYFLLPAYRPQWYYDYGNNINAGDHNLWASRAAAHRIFRRTGLAGVWHQDNLGTVPDTGRVVPGFATNLSGSGSAWCALRLSGDPNAPIDPYTGNAYTSDLQYSDFRAPTATRSAYPGYASQWDQLMYRDFPYNSSTPGTVAFDFRVELNSSPVGDPGGSGWFTPDPFDSYYNMVVGSGAAEPVDSFEVWAGAPKETGVYDPAHRYLSDTIDFGLGGADAPQLIFSTTGVVNGSVAPALPAGASWGTVRVVFRVKTNRFFDDRAPGSTPNPTGWNSTTGAVVLDNIDVNGALSDFETPGQILPRFSWTDLGGGAADITENLPVSSWITTGRQPAHYGHVENIGNLPIHDPAGGTLCNLFGNVALQSNHDNPRHDFMGETQNWMISPTICLTGPRAAAQGIPPTLRAEAAYLKVVFDFYPGNSDISDTGILFMYACRSMGS